MSETGNQAWKCQVGQQRELIERVERWFRAASKSLSIQDVDEGTNPVQPKQWCSKTAVATYDMGIWEGPT